METHVCKCGNEIPQQTIDAITLKGKYPEFAKRAKCADCVANKRNDVERVAGYNPSESKMRGSIVITDQETAAQYLKLSARPSGHTSHGVTRSRPKRSGWM